MIRLKNVLLMREDTLTTYKVSYKLLLIEVDHYLWTFTDLWSRCDKTHVFITCFQYIIKNVITKARIICKMHIPVDDMFKNSNSKITGHEKYQISQWFAKVD